MQTQLEVWASISKVRIVQFSIWGGVLPAQLNLANLEAAVDSIPLNNIDGLMAALKHGIEYAKNKFPPNSIIEDKYDGEDAPLVIGHYGTGYGTSRQGVYLFREKVNPTSQIWDRGMSSYYASSSINGYLNGTYLDNCSDKLKECLVEINVPYYGRRGAAKVAAKLFLLSATEIMGYVFGGDGVQWDAWKQRTGLTSPSSAANKGRVLADNAEQLAAWWTRTGSSSNENSAYAVSTDGSLITLGTLNGSGVIIGCFIAAD